MNSSIFNFDPLRRALRLPRAEHLWHAVLALGACGVFVACLVLVQKLKPEALSSYFEKGSLGDANILILGDSQFRMISPGFFPAPTQNRAMSGSDYEIQEALLDSLAERAPKLKLAILELDATPMFVPGIARRNGDFRDVTGFGVPVSRIPSVPWAEKAMYWLRYNEMAKPLLIGPKYELADPYPIDSASRKKPSSEKPGPKPHPGFSVLPTEGKKKMAGYVGTFKKSNNEKINRESLRKMLAYCWEHKIKVALLMPPLAKEFLESRPKEWTQMLQEVRSEAEKNAPPGMLEVWDEQSGLQYPIDDFADPNHILSEKSGDFSKAVADRAKAFLAK